MASEAPNFGQYWIHPRLKSGQFASGVLFDHDAFAEEYGENAANAVGEYRHRFATPPTSLEQKRLLDDAINTLKRLGLDPQEIIAAKSNARNEDT